MRILLGHRANVGYVVSHCDVTYVEIRRRPVRQVADDERVRHASMLVHDDEVRDVVGPASVNQLFHFVITCEKLTPKRH